MQFLIQCFDFRTAHRVDLAIKFIISYLHDVSTHRIMNRSMDLGIFPTMWKKANVAAVWKGKGSKTEAGNYRPISILPVLARVFERVVAGQLSRHCDAHNVIPAEQFGFRQGASCESALVAATDEWLRQLDEGKIVSSLLIDL